MEHEVKRGNFLGKEVNTIINIALVYMYVVAQTAYPNAMLKPTQHIEKIAFFFRSMRPLYLTCLDTSRLTTKY